MTELINCGERRIQQGYRITLLNACKRHDIREGDTVEVFIKAVKPQCNIEITGTTAVYPILYGGEECKYGYECDDYAPVKRISSLDCRKRVSYMQSHGGL